MHSIFGQAKVLIGMIHVRALPGSPNAELSVEALVEEAVREAGLYQEAGFHALLIENMHDRPYMLGSADSAVVATMTVVGREIRRLSSLPLGVQILTGANREALAVAHAVGASFIRAESFVFAHIAHSGMLQACAGDLVRYRQAIGADGVRIFADIKKKHAAHVLTQDVDIVREATTAQRFLADGVIVTGPETASPADMDEVRLVGSAVDLPVFVGSGITLENMARYLVHADGLIVGSSLKHKGLWSEPIDENAAIAMAKEFLTQAKPSG